MPCMASLGHSTILTVSIGDKDIFFYCNLINCDCDSLFSTSFCPVRLLLSPVTSSDFCEVQRSKNCIEKRVIFALLDTKFLPLRFRNSTRSDVSVYFRTVSSSVFCVA